MERIRLMCANQKTISRLERENENLKTLLIHKRVRFKECEFFVDEVRKTTKEGCGEEFILSLIPYGYFNRPKSTRKVIRLAEFIRNGALLD